MRIFVKTLTLFAVLFAFTATAKANDFEPQIKAFYDSTVKAWLSDPAVIEAIKAQNAETSGYDAGKIDTLDKQWRAEAKAGGGDLVNKVAGNSLSGWLKQKKEEAGGKIAEIFVMDAKGLNVGMSDTTSDYMQGDEGKHQKTYGAGADAVFIDEVEFDESSGAFQSQLSATISDGGSPIGAITVGVNVEKL
ncbi:hypothetical protein NUH88_21605 [Nisaea acidiphila]|uniref:Uncharacterized protein n=1 Tax=Nisaea acidiphila TaxID=1862145 RepID=A0A9J7AQT7_9PROT|nr:hypothetical protein [Nisaea acidiphila]UUX49971.1 hypothetical protein NUH88_21605 [Nisaea acidiphila]